MGLCDCRRPSADDPDVIRASVDVCEKHDPLFAQGTNRDVMALFKGVIRIVERQRERIREDTRRFIE
jgi:hypothetical protein